MSERKFWPDVTELFAVEHVGPRRWGKHWIPGLTDDQRRLLEQDGLLGESANVGDLRRQQESEKDASAERQELTAARLQQALILKQRREVHRFLDGWNLRKYPGRINWAKLEAALDLAFPQAEAKLDTGQHGGDHTSKADIVSFAPVHREPTAPSAETIADWIIARRQELIGAKENHGRDRLLSEAAKALRVPIKQAREVWATHGLAQKNDAAKS